MSVEVPDGFVRMEIPNGVANRDFSEVFSTKAGPRKTKIVRRETGSGSPLDKMTIRGRFAANVVGPKGLVALTPPRSEGATPWLPDARVRTTVVVADSMSGTERRYRLRGNFEPEAFSTNGRRLYMIEYIPPSEPNRYRVRILSLSTGEVSAIGRLKGQAPDQMRGTGRMQVYAPDGDELYTLYTRQGPNYAHGTPVEVSPHPTNAFIHLLNLEDGWAHCIDLPLPFGKGRATASAIEVSPDGGRVFVTDWTNGAVAVVDPDDVKVLSVAQIHLGDADDETFATTGGSRRLYVAGNDSVVTIDISSMKAVDRWQMDGEVTGLEVGPDGRTVYVAVGESVTMIDAAGGAQVGVVAVDAVTNILNVF
jgi:hypothetical protein